MQNMRGDYDHRLGIKPATLVVPPALERQARQLIVADRDTYGATNVWAGSADLIVTPWL